MSNEQQQVSDIYLKRENLKEVEEELLTAREKLEQTEFELQEAKKYCKYLIVSLLFLVPSFWLQDFKRTFLIFVGFAFLVHIILMDIGIGQVITVLFKGEKDKREKQVEEKKQTVEEKREELYNALSKLSGKTNPAEKAVKEKILTSREEVWKELKEIREKVDRENINHTGWVDDKLLQDIVLTMPLTKDEFLQLPGSNKNTYQNFGKEFMEEIQGYYFSNLETDEKGVEETKQAAVTDLVSEKYLKILQMCQQEASLAEIIDQCQTSENELIKLITTDVVALEIEDLIPSNAYHEIKAAIEEVESNDFVSVRQRVADQINSNYITLMLTYERQRRKTASHLQTPQTVEAENKTATNLEVVDTDSEGSAAEKKQSETAGQSDKEELTGTAEKNKAPIMPDTDKKLMTQVITAFESYYQENEEAVQINQPSFKENYFTNIDCEIDKLKQILTDCSLIYKVDSNCFALNSWILLGLAKTVFAAWERAKFIVIEIKVRDILGVNQVNKSELLELLTESEYFELENNDRFVKFAGDSEELEASLEKLYQPFKNRNQKLAGASQADSEEVAGQEKKERV